MALFRKLFYRKPPDGLLEICEKVYVFDCCFATDSPDKEDYKVYIRRIVGQFREQFADASVLVFNFRGGDEQSELSGILSELDMTIMDYPRQYEGCPLLTMEVIHHFLRSCESWLSLGQNNLLLMHCERGGWPVLAFMLAALLLYMKLYHGEQRTLDMVYKQAPRELLQFFSPLNPIPSQLRYLQYVSRRNVGTEWPPLDRALTLDCVIIRFIPNFDREGGCRPIFRIYGQDPFLVNDRTPKRLFSTAKRSKNMRAYKQVECELVKIDINCHIQGDVVVECISLCADMEQEETMFRVMFNTAFIRSNILMLNPDEIDMLWDAKDLFPKEFRVELLFSEMDAAASIAPIDFSCFEEKDGLPVEAFAKVQEMFNHVDWLDPVTDAALQMLQKINSANIVPENLHMKCRHGLEGCCSPKTSPKSHEKSKHGTRRLSSSSFGEEDLLSLALKSSSHRTSGTHASKLMPVFTNSEEDPPALVLEDQTSSPTSPVKGLLHDRASSKGTQAVDLPSVPSSTVQDPNRTSSAEFIAPISAIISSSTPPWLDIVDSTVRTPLLTPSLTPPPPPPPPPPLPPKPVQEETNCCARSSSMTPSAGEQPPRPPPPPLLPTPLAGSSNLKGPLPPPSSTPITPPPAPPPPIPPSAPPPPTSPQAPPPPTPPLQENRPIKITPPPPPPLPSPSGQSTGPKVSPPVPLQAPPTPKFSSMQISSPGNSLGILSAPPPPPPSKNSPVVPSAPSPPTQNSSGLPSAPPPPTPPGKAVPKMGSPSPPPLITPGNAKGRGLSRGNISLKGGSTKKLKPLHWLKLSRAVQGSIWAEAQKSGEATKAPEIDMSELETLFSASVPAADSGRKPGQRGSSARKPDKVQLIDHRRAYNCEIMLSKVKVPLHELMCSVLSLEDSALDIDQVENLIKFCPTKEEMELLKGYNGEKDKLGKCEQFFLELMQVPRVESKLRVFSFKMQFLSQVSDLRNSLNVVNSAAEEIRNSVKLKRIMQTILSLGNALNQGTARGSAIGFKLDSLLKLTETRARNNKMTLMHYLCKVLADKLPEVLDFSKDLANTEPASKIQLKFLAEEMQAISKGLEKVVQELALAENDGPISENFCKILKEFLHFAEAEVRSLASLYSGVGRNVDALILYFGEDPARCPFEQVISTLMNFQRMFNKAHEENCKQIELEMKKALESDKSKMGASHKEVDHLLQAPIQSSNVH